MKSIWQTQVGEIQDTMIHTLVFELALVRGWTPQDVARERLFPYVQSIFRDSRGKYARVPVNCVLPGGLLRSKIGQISPGELRNTLAELGRMKSVPMCLKVNEGKTVLEFLNMFHNTRRQKPPMFFKP